MLQDVMAALRDLNSDNEDDAAKKEPVVVEAPVEEVVDVIIKTPGNTVVLFGHFRSMYCYVAN